MEKIMWILKRKVIPNLFILFILSFFFLGCAGTGLKTERKVDPDNVLHSSSRPKITIKINPEMKLLKKTDDQNHVPNSLGGERVTNVVSEKFVFAARDRHAVIEFSRFAGQNWYFGPQLFNKENSIEFGTVDIHGKQFQYSIFAFKEKGGYLLVKGIATRIGANNSARLKIYYAKPVAGTWNDPNRLTGNQRKEVQNLIDGFEKDIKILDFS
jgi:hypothetical protein